MFANRASRFSTLIFLLSVFLTSPGLRAQLPGPVEPSDEEQALIYELNRARHDPEAYGRRIGVDLTGVLPRPPLAVNLRLTGSARFHAEEMENDNHEYFAHVSQVTGDGPNRMAVQNGYNLFGRGVDPDIWSSENFIESIARGINQMKTFSEALATLIEDKDVPGKGHRRHLLALTEQDAEDREIGAGKAQGKVAQATPSTPERFVGRPEFLYAIHTGWVNREDTFLTGVVYQDRNKNGLYDAGEGLGGVTIQVVSATVNTSVESLRAGGYSALVPPGTYTLTVSGGSYQGEGTAEVTVAGNNMEVDFPSGQALGEINFVKPDSPPGGGGDPEPTPAPEVRIVSSATRGIAPLEVTFTAESPDEGIEFSWGLPDGTTATGGSVTRVFDQPGIYTVTLSGTGASGTGKASEVIAVGGPGGAGEGTTLPASTTLDVRSLGVRANFKKPGKDAVKVKGTLEMPAGFQPGPDHSLEVSVGGVTVLFQLDAKNRGRDATGKASLKFRKVKGGGPLGAGVVAKFQIALKGDFAARLQALGLRNETGSSTLERLPVALLLNELAYSGAVRASVSARAGARASARLIRE